MAPASTGPSCFVSSVKARTAFTGTPTKDLQLKSSGGDPTSRFPTRLSPERRKLCCMMGQGVGNASSLDDWGEDAEASWQRRPSLFQVHQVKHFFI